MDKDEVTTRPSANLDLVRSIFAAWEHGDFTSIEWADPSIEWVTADGPTPGSWRGVAGMGEASRDWVNAWEGYRAEAHEYRELDDGRVFVLFRYRGRGKASGVELGELGTSGAGLFQIRDGRVTRLVHYTECEHAFADLGLEE